MKKLICAETLYTDCVPAVEFQNWYLGLRPQFDNVISGLTGYKTLEAAKASRVPGVHIGGITVKISRSLVGDFTIAKVDEFTP